jgi:hypothetical protein
MLPACTTPPPGPVPAPTITLQQCQTVQQFCVRRKTAPMTEYFSESEVNEALDRLRSGLGAIASC